MRLRQKHNTEGVTLSDFPAWEKRSRHTDGPNTRRLSGARNRRFLSSFEKDGVEYTLHATKGIRRARKTFNQEKVHV